MSNVIRKMKILKNILKINARNTSKMKNAFDGFISRLNTAKERFTESEDMSICLPKLKRKQKKKNKENQNRMSKNCETITKGTTYAYQAFQKEKQEKMKQRKYLK